MIFSWFSVMLDKIAKYSRLCWKEKGETLQTKSQNNWTVRTSIGRMQSVDRVQKIRIRSNSKSSLKGNFAVSSLVHYYQFIPVFWLCLCNLWSLSQSCRFKMLLLADRELVYERKSLHNLFIQFGVSHNLQLNLLLICYWWCFNNLWLFHLHM